MEIGTLNVGGLPIALCRREVSLAMKGGETLVSFLATEGGNLEELVERLGVLEHRWPYWLEEWPAAYVLAEFVLQRPSLISGSVLDVGCGSGFIATALKGVADDIMSADFNPDACRLARRNTGIASSVVCADYRSSPFKGRFKTILMADLAYQPDMAKAIADFLEAGLEPGGTAWMGDPGRSAFQRFMAGLEKEGWIVVDSMHSPSRAEWAACKIYSVTKPKGSVQHK